LLELLWRSITTALPLASVSSEVEVGFTSVLSFLISTLDWESSFVPPASSNSALRSWVDWQAARLAAASRAKQAVVIGRELNRTPR
jgi:hypothetical protein